MKDNTGNKYKTGWTPPPMELCGTGPVPEYRIEKRHTDVDKDDVPSGRAGSQHTH